MIYFIENNKKMKTFTKYMVIRNPLRSLLMKIDTTSSYSSARKLADDKSACRSRRFCLFSTYRDMENPFGL